jgi:hypothetical protein
LATTRALLFVFCTAAFIQTARADAAPTAPTAADPTAAPAAPATAPAAADPAAASSPAAPSPQTSDEAFDVRVKGLEEQVNDIKEKIFRTKARLLLLQETVVGGDIVSGARAVIVHQNEMGSTFYLTSASYALDGSPIFTKVDVNGDLAEKDHLEIFNGRIVPGTHQLTVKLEYQGHGFGPINYLEGYKFKVTSSEVFNAEGGKTTTIKAIGYEKGGPFTELKDKPDVKYETAVSRELAKPDSKSDDASKSGSSNP